MRPTCDLMPIGRQAHAPTDGGRPDREIGRAAIRKFLSGRGAAGRIAPMSGIFTASHITTLPLT